LNELKTLLDSSYDFSKDYDNKFTFIQAIVNRFKKIDFSEIKENELFDYTKIIDITLNKIIEINNSKFLEEILDILIKLLQYLNLKNYHRYSLEIIQSINKHYGNRKFKIIVQNNSSSIIYEIEKSKNRYFKDKKYRIYRQFCEAIIKIYKISDIEIEHIEYEIGLTYHLEAINQQNREVKSNSVKAHFLEQAEKHYKNKCQNIELSKDLRPLIKSCYGLLVEDELQEFKTEMPPTNLMKIELFHYKRIYLKDLEKNLILKQLSVDSNLLPNYNEMVISTKTMNRKLELTLIHTLSKTIINEKRKLGTYHTSRENDEYHISQHYNLTLEMTWYLRLFPIFTGMINNNRLTATSIMSHISKWSLLDKSRIVIIGRGIDRFFQNDYISSINILVPQIEYHLRYMFELTGSSTTNTLDGRSQEEQTFGSFLKEEFVIKTLGIDIVKYFEIMFVSKIGFNIRNNVAHGFYDENHFSKELNIIVIYSLIVLTRFNLKKDINN